VPSGANHRVLGHGQRVRIQFNHAFTLARSDRAECERCILASVSRR
jgi:hypothetical protein